MERRHNAYIVSTDDWWAGLRMFALRSGRPIHELIKEALESAYGGEIEAHIFFADDDTQKSQLAQESVSNG